jgi:hypothetical protein
MQLKLSPIIDGWKCPRNYVIGSTATFVRATQWNVWKFITNIFLILNTIFQSRPRTMNKRRTKIDEEFAVQLIFVFNTSITIISHGNDRVTLTKL